MVVVQEVLLVLALLLHSVDFQISSWRVPQAEEVVASVRAAGGEAVAIQADVTVPVIDGAVHFPALGRLFARLRLGNQAVWSALIAAAFAKVGLAVRTDLTNQKINAKVREHSLLHVPVLAVVGRKEAEAGTVALRRLGSPAQEILTLDTAVASPAAEATPPDLR